MPNVGSSGPPADMAITETIDKSVHLLQFFGEEKISFKYKNQNA